MFKENMAEVAAPHRGRYLRNNTTINPWVRGYIINNLLIWSDTRARMMSTQKDDVIRLLLVLHYFNNHNSDERCQGDGKGRFGGEKSDRTAGPMDS